MESIERLKKISQLATFIGNKAHSLRIQEICDAADSITMLAEKDAKFIQDNLANLEKDLKRFES